MKKLTNVSPFLLLLFPVFVMLFLAIATNNTSANNEEVATKTNSTNPIAKVTSAIIK